MHCACMCAQSHSCGYHSFDDTCTHWARSISFEPERLAGVARQGTAESMRSVCDACAPG
ncbi:hypothetical protein [Lysobacter gummosus]|uniref:hypothetical protein n=1 Tax=Lysobacter gummosus TaxID=262324 RepID=UPI0036312303